MRKIYATALIAGVLSGCVNLAPEYARPVMPVPASVGGVKDSISPVVIPAWQDLVTDVRLKKLVELAITNNRDLRVAALNVDKARAAYRIADAARYPAIKASGSDSISSSQDSVTRRYSATVGVSSYELDFFSRLKNLSDADLNSYFAMAATQRSTRLSLIAEVANGWLTLAADQDLLRLAQKTWDSRQKTVELTQKQKALGASTALALAQQEAAAESARGDVASYASQVVQDLNALELLAGTSIPVELLPAETDRIDTHIATLLELPAGLPSEQLLDRPDIVAAELALKSAYANIGAARAAFFPSISLTGSAGTASSSLGELFKAGTGVWAFTPAIALPIFNAGSLKASLDSAQISRDIQVASYEKTIQTAFREVADALAARKVFAERLSAQENQVVAYEKSLRLTRALYRAGSDSYLNVLDSQRSLYAVQKSLIALQLAEQSNRITLFKVLGGY